ncbi:MAG: winged helix-turn-helix domain-containing protein [Owenweeksia sp.]
MIRRIFIPVLFIFTALFLSGQVASAQKIADEQYIEVSLRMIGHQILLSSGDSTSLVLPVEKEEERYRLSFGSEFRFVPEELVAIVGGVVEETGIAGGYLVEVEECGTNRVVYSYKIGNLAKSDLVPCKGRLQPENCYTLLFTILEAGNIQEVLAKDQRESSQSLSGDTTPINYTTVLFILAGLLVLTGVWSYIRKRHVNDADPDTIVLGAYHFDPKNMRLLHKGERIELTSKESELLLLLHKYANETLERERILNSVWGDEGDYVGRTLDVFISKLRKKLEEDPRLKIANIRGVGYKFIVNR